MSDEWTIEDTKNIGRLCGMIGKGILLGGLGLAIGIPFLGLLQATKNTPWSELTCSVLNVELCHFLRLRVTLIVTITDADIKVR